MKSAPLRLFFRGEAGASFIGGNANDLRYPAASWPVQGTAPQLDTAIDYLLTHDLAALPLGRTEVDGDKVFINLMDATLHRTRATTSEYHKLYADLQVDLTGSEGWGYTNLPGAEIGEFTGDCGFQASESVVTGTLGEGRFVLFFPEELHKPGLVQHGCVSVRKAVVKIRMEE